VLMVTCWPLTMIISVSLAGLPVIGWTFGNGLGVTAAFLTVSISPAGMVAAGLPASARAGQARPPRASMSPKVLIRGMAFMSHLHGKETKSPPAHHSAWQATKRIGGELAQEAGISRPGWARSNVRRQRRGWQQRRGERRKSKLTRLGNQ